MCAFPRNGILAVYIDPKHCCHFFFLFGICEFCDGSDRGLSVCGWSIVCKWHYYPKLQTDVKGALPTLSTYKRER